MEAQMVQAVGTIVSPVAMVALVVYLMRSFGGRLDQLDDRIVRLDEGLGARIERLDARLSERIEQLDARLSERIDKLDARLSERIDKLDARLSESIDKLDARLSQRMDRIDSRMEGLQNDHKDLASQLSDVQGRLAT